MKIALIIILICCCTYIGHGFSKYYTSRKVFFEDMILLMDKLKLDIAFSKEKIGNIISSFEPMSKHQKKLCQNFLGMLQNNKFETDKLFENITILKSDEKNVLGIFFKTLGRFDLENQTNQIISFQNQIQQYKDNAQSLCDKYGSIFTKLGFIVGVLLALILL